MNIALLTGRGCSVSLPDKNVIKVLNRPMMTYPAIMAQQSKNIDDIYISTDGEKLISIAEDMGIKVIHSNLRSWQNPTPSTKMQ